MILARSLMMAFPSWLLILTVLFNYKGAIALYQWNCSEPDESREIYIPGISRDYLSAVIVGTTDGGAINIFHIQNLTAECTGEVTAIEFCYRYTMTGPGEPVFNWTMLILNETDVQYTVTRIIIIESHPNLLSEGDCEAINTEQGTIKCCDRDYISSFNLQTSDFVFGVTQSAQGNTHDATLLGFHATETEYNVLTVTISNAGQTKPVGSSIPKSSAGLPRGLRMLWLVTGNSPTTSTNTDEGFTTVPPFSTTSSEALTTTVAAISTPESRGSDSNVNQQSRAQVDAGVVVGSLIGTVVAVILLSAVIVLTLALVHLARKYKSVTKAQLQGTRIAVAQNTYTLDMEMNFNDAYAPSIAMSRLDSMESNAAYGGMTVANQEDNNVTLYETIKSIDRPGEGITEAHVDSTEAHLNEEDLTGGTVYEYIDEDDK